MQSRRVRVAAAAIVAGLVFAQCHTGMAHRWRDPRWGIEFRSDFEPVATSLMLEGQLLESFAALHDLFGNPDMTGVEIWIHDQAGLQVDGGTVGGWHADGRIHVMAGWGDARLAFPSVAARELTLHELVHALVLRSALELPRWFEEGLCEVLAGSAVVDGGDLVWMPNGGRERRVRHLRAEGHWLGAEELFACVERYPEDAIDRDLLYAEGTSFVWSLLAPAPPRDRAGIATLAGLPPAALRVRFDAWAAALDATTLVMVMRPFLEHGHAAVRELAVSSIHALGTDEELWRLAGHLLADPSPAVRGSMRIRAIGSPARHPTARRRYAEWAAAEDPQLRRAGLLANALLGDPDATVRFCRDLTNADSEWAQPLIWLILTLPDEGLRASMAGVLAGGDAMAAAAARIVELFEAIDSPTWSEQTRRYVRR